MSAVKDVQHSLNVIRQLSTDENAAVQTQILELMLQASISQLKSISTEANTATKPKPLPIPKPAKPAAPSPKTKPKPQPSLNTRLIASERSNLKRLQVDAHTLLFNTAKICAFCIKFCGSLVLHKTIDGTNDRHSANAT